MVTGSYDPPVDSNAFRNAKNQNQLMTSFAKVPFLWFSGFEAQPNVSVYGSRLISQGHQNLQEEYERAVQCFNNRHSGDGHGHIHVWYLSNAVFRVAIVMD
ncbi:hypothetical protein VNO77_27242 [Canavalia gladiata]|uniref:Uncharacterized protein n=1 Tax=Canavalia gladiata TaxID=3824 RepID=A0AAN9Q6B0_CANGL